LFEAYLAEHGYPAPAHEPDLGIEKHPDYLVERGGAECICEIKEFGADFSPAWAGQQVSTTSLKVVLQPLRDKIRSAAKQLKPLEGSGRALAIVIANPHGVMAPLGEREAIWTSPGLTDTVETRRVRACRACRASSGGAGGCRRPRCS
jgi:hypothetical protein